MSVTSAPPDGGPSIRPVGPGPKRQLRNFLLEPHFQFKYTSMVVAVTVAVAAVLGSFAYDYSKGQTEMMTMQRMDAAASRGQAIGPEVMADIQKYAEQADRLVLLGIIGGVFCLALALGFTGIIVTHRVVGPAYRLKMLLRQVRDGHLKGAGRLRKGDELQDVFIAFQEMVTSMRRAQQEEITLLDDALAKAKQAGVPDEAILEVRKVRDRMQSALD